MGSFGIGMASTYLGDTGKAQEAFVNIYRTLDNEVKIDPYERKPNIKIEGNIKFEDVEFFYETRPGNKVLKKISFEINKGQSAAFVGPSGCGKSTIIQLIERFYDIQGGKITFDGHDIKDFDLVDLRRQIGLVSQEPVLFKRKVRENIAYGKLNASDKEVEEAAKKAYISELLEMGKVDEKSNISGGQKQRVAIARAIIKNPTILLLDEATSALDKNSEEIVQKALDDVMIGRTSITIAHRLSTIINNDIIFYMEDGAIHEQGSHKELLEMKGKYYRLYSSMNIR